MTLSTSCTRSRSRFARASGWEIAYCILTSPAASTTLSAAKSLHYSISTGRFTSSAICPRKTASIWLIATIRSSATSCCYRCSSTRQRLCGAISTPRTPFCRRFLARNTIGSRASLRPRASKRRRSRWRLIRSTSLISRSSLASCSVRTRSRCSSRRKHDGSNWAIWRSFPLICPSRRSASCAPLTSRDCCCSTRPLATPRALKSWPSSPSSRASSTSLSLPPSSAAGRPTAWRCSLPPAARPRRPSWRAPTCPARCRGWCSCGASSCVLSTPRRRIPSPIRLTTPICSKDSSTHSRLRLGSRSTSYKRLPPASTPSMRTTRRAI
mmetsp:Transcript_29798/g.69507  ORF Transcript_29798/g.69507 Transcript_29798/m.69507 type:complete len:325 (+) Transcript_29798:1597-2571(+)